jgi:outer membrane protein assembly factor BamB/TolA-binding protein
MMTPEQLLAHLEARELVSEKVLKQLQEKRARSPDKYDTYTLVKLLVDHGQLTESQARRLLKEEGRAPAVEPQDAEQEFLLTPSKLPLPQQAGGPDAPREDELEIVSGGDAAGQQAAAPSRDHYELAPLSDDLTEAAQQAKASRPPAPPRQAWRNDDSDRSGTPQRAAPPRSARQQPPAPQAPARQPRSEPSPPAPQRQPSSRAAPVVAPTRPARSTAPAAPQGGLDDLLSEALGSNAQAFDASVLAGPPRRKGFWSWLRAVRGSQPGKYREDWGGPLMMVGGGVVILLGILAVALWLSIGRKSADEAFQSAEADYQSGAYAQARGKFESFLEKYPRHPSAPIVRVHLGLTQMRQAVERRAKWSEALRTAKDVLGRISKEETFVDAQADLAGMLPEIANGLAAEARRTRSAKQVAEAREALRLLGKYVPKKLLPAERIREIEKSLDLTSRLLAQGTALDEAVHQIELAIGRGDIKAGYEIRARLVKENPDLANNKKLREAVESLTQAERAAVRYVAEARTAQTQEAEGSLLASEAVATPLQAGTAPGVAGHVLMVLAEGNVYGIDAATGRLLWRRHVGFETSFLPHPVSPDAASDAILVDAQRGELLRIESPTGSLRWRHALASGVQIYPTVLRDTVLAATDQGHLVAIDLATGASNGRMEFPQPLAAAAAVDESQQHYYAIGSHSNLYVVAAADNSCQQAYYVGHDPGTVRVAPLVVDRYVVVAENRTATDALLHVLLADEEGRIVNEVQRLRLAGHIYLPPQASGNKLFVATDRGALYSYEISPPDERIAQGESPALTSVAEYPPDDQEPLARYYLLRGAKLWLAGRDLTRFDIESARGRLTPKWKHHEGDSFLQPPQGISQVVFHARRKAGVPGISVTAIDGDTAAVLWETLLAAPPAGALWQTPPPERLAIVTRAGALHVAGAAQLSGHRAAEAHLAGTLGNVHAIRMPAGAPAGLSAFLVGNGRTLLVIDARGEEPRVQPLSLTDPAVQEPTPFHGGLLVPTNAGQVLLIDAVHGGSLLEPFQPRLELGRLFDWGRPLLVGADEVVICDGRDRLYRLTVEQEPPPRLRAAAEANLLSPLSTPLVLHHGLVVGADAAGQLRAFELANLSAQSAATLGAAVAWGPAVASEHLLVATHAGELWCFGPDLNEPLWKRPLPHGPLAEGLLSQDQAVLLATRSGTLYRVSLANGAVEQTVELRQPLAAGPLARNGQGLLVLAHDGALLLAGGL